MANKPQMKDTILVAVDFTPYSKKAILFAGDLAEKLGARILVLHVIYDPPYAPGFYVKQVGKKKLLASMEEAAEEMMADFIKNLRKTYPEKKVFKKAVPMLVVGTPAMRITEVAEKEKVSMIVVGSHGRTGFSKFMIGSKAERVVKLSNIPVIVVKSAKEI